MEQAISVIERVDSSDVPNFRLFSAGQIAVATFFGSLLAGGLMLARNYSKLGEKDKAHRAVIFSFIAFVLLWLGSAALVIDVPDSKAGPMMTGINFWIAVGFRFMINHWQGKQFDDHIRRGGEKVSGWNFAAIVASIAIALMACGILVLNLVNS